MKPSDDRFDILIIGGGITGLYAAIAFQSSGYRVAVIERAEKELIKAGESLDPECKTYFSRFGLYFDSDCVKEYTGHVVSWGHDPLHVTDFIFHPFGNGWCIDRGRFEQSLIGKAQNIGVKYMQPAVITDRSLKDRCWAINISTPRGRIAISASFVIHATGRNVIRPQQGTTKKYYDGLLALSFYSYSIPGPANNAKLLIEALENGWLYANRLPGERYVLTLFTDKDILSRNRKAYFKHALYYSSRQCFAEQVTDSTKLYCYDARTYWNEQQAGQRWIALGEAAYAIDPLSGQGILKNLQMVERLREIMSGVVSGNTDLVKDFIAWNRRVFDEALQTGQLLYSTENLWSQSSLFWSRRSISRRQQSSMPKEISAT